MSQEHEDYADPSRHRRRPLLWAILAATTLLICLAVLFSDKIGDWLVDVGIVKERAYHKAK